MSAERAGPSLVTSLQSLRPGSGFNRSSKLKVRAARGYAASPDTDGLRIPSRVSRVRCGGSCRLAVDKRAVSRARALVRYRSRCGTAAYFPRPLPPSVATPPPRPTYIGLPDFVPRELYEYALQIW